MKKIIVLLFVLSMLCMAVATAQAYTAGGTFTGSAMVGTNAGSTLSVQTSNNVYMSYNGSSQTYGAATKNRAGDKIYATGGGQGSASGLYYQQADTNVGLTTITDPTSMFAAGSGWVAQ
jgi:hypothetical protein